MRRRARGPAVSDLGAPPEFLDPAAEVWHSRPLYVRYMAERRWSLPPQERMGCDSSPENRRQEAIAEWAVANGITTEDRQFPDWHRLRRAFDSTERTVAR